MDHQLETAGEPKPQSARGRFACDVCRSRKIKCQYKSGETRCDGCIFLETECTHDRPRRRRGPRNRHAIQYSQGIGCALRTNSNQSGTASQVASPHILSPPNGSLASSLPSPWTNPDFAVRQNNWLAAFAPLDLLIRVIEDWFDQIHSVAPILHRRCFLKRLHDGEANTNPVFCGLIVSVCAAVVATLKRGEYGPLTVQQCLTFIDTHRLLFRFGGNPAYSVDWCTAMYNIGTASATLTAIDDVQAYHAGSEAAAGVRYLMYYCMGKMSRLEEEMLKRLFWLLFAWACSSDIFGRLSVGPLVTYQDNLPQLRRPLRLTDRELDAESYLSTHIVSPWPGDDISYVPGLNYLSDLFMVWHEAQSCRNSDPSIALQSYLTRIQDIIDSLPPSLRWRGGLSRPTSVTPLHDTQLVNLYITALHIRSNLLQNFGSDVLLTDSTDNGLGVGGGNCKTVGQVALEHQRIVGDLLEILYHMPQAVFDANGSSMVPKIRDIGAAYLEQVSLGREGPWDGAKEKIEKLLKKLDLLDFGQGMAFLRGNDQSPD